MRSRFSRLDWGRWLRGYRREKLSRMPLDLKLQSREAAPDGTSRMGFRGKVARSTLADANEAHDWRIYADFAPVLIRMARPLYTHDPIGVDLDQSLYALDSTTIDLCLSLFRWARFRQHKAAGKMHKLLDLQGQHPHVYPHHRGQSARRQHPRRDPSRARCLLRHGSGLCRF